MFRNGENTPYTALRLACVYHALLHMKLFFAGATHAGQICVLKQNRVTLKTLLVLDGAHASDYTLDFVSFLFQGH
jgi:hypothetical protein